jgi:hypothetical protein
MSDAEGSTLAEIVDAIVDELDLPEAQLVAARVEVRRLIDASFQHMGRGLVPRAGKRVLAERAERIAELADALELELLNLPPPLHYLITPPSARFGAPPASDQLEAIRKEHLEALLQPLRVIRLDCERFVAGIQAEQIRPGPEIDYVQRYCAEIAYGLIDRFSTRQITTSGPEGPLNIVAGLVYEAFTGRPGADLRRHCDFVRESRPHLIQSKRTSAGR